MSGRHETPMPPRDADAALATLKPRAPDVAAYARIRAAIDATSGPPPPASRWRAALKASGAAVIVLAGAWLLFRAQPRPVEPPAPTDRATPAPIAAATPRDAPRPATSASPSPPVDADDSPPTSLPPPVAPRVEARGSLGAAPATPSNRKRRDVAVGSLGTTVASPGASPIAASTPVLAVAPAAPVSDSHARVEAELLAGAVNALRRDGDPARAAMLLDFYRDRHRDGALYEEALVLSIEAAAARHDLRARTFAEEYLRRYPHGRYRSLADDMARQF